MEFRNVADIQSFPALERNYITAADLVIDHYSLVGGTDFHGAIVYRLVNDQVDEILWYADEDTRIQTVEAFYNAVDTKSFDLIDANVITSQYLAVFGPGKAMVGGARHDASYPEQMDLAAFKTFLGEWQARCVLPFDQLA